MAELTHPILAAYWAGYLIYIEQLKQQRVTTKEAAEELGRALRTVQKDAADGKLPSESTGRDIMFRLGDVLAFKADLKKPKRKRGDFLKK